MRKHALDSEVPVMVNAPAIQTTLFATPNVPDLGCHVERRHDFQIDSEWALWAEFAPWYNQEGHTA